ncbi:MAG: flavin reductase family protein [Pseudomonadota bacterium]
MSRFVPGPNTARQFRTALGRFVTGVTVVTCHSEKGPLGITANSFASVSLDPPLVLWSPAKSSSRHDAFLEAENFVIHVLDRSQASICAQFTKDGFNFKGLDLSSEVVNAPLIQGCLAHFECRRFAAHDAGDHTVILGEVLSAATRDGAPLVFSAGVLGRFEEGIAEKA